MTKSIHARPWTAAVIRELRRLAAEREMRQQDIAAATGLSQSTVSRLLTGQQELCLDHLDTIANALGAEPMRIIARTRRRASSPRTATRPRHRS